MDGVRPKVRGRLLVAVVGSAVAMLVVAGGSFAAAGAQASGPPTIQGEEDKLADVDNRRGRKAPSARQRDRVKAGSEARFNKFGAPEAVSDPGAFLATGLPSDDVAAARAYLSANRELLGLSEEALAELRGPQRTGARRGERRPVPPALRRPAGRTRRPRDRGGRRGQGRVPVVVADDRDRADRLRHHLVRGRGSRRGRGRRSCSRRDLESPCGEQLDADGRRGLQRPGPRAARRGADADRRRQAGVRGPADGHRRRRSAWVRRASWTRRAPRCSCATGSCSTPPTTRRGRCSQPRRRSTTRRPTRGSSGAGTSPPRRRAARRRSRTRRRPRAGTRTQRSARRGSSRAATTPARRRSGTRTSATRRASTTRLGHARLRLPVDEPVVHVALQPGLVHVAAAERHRRGEREPARDAQPHARLVVRPRLHRDDVQRAGVQLRARRRAERSGARERAGRRHRRRPARVRLARQREPVLAERRRRAGDEHVPLAADPVDVLRAVRRRRLRHVRDRARVRPPGLEPDGRRAERRPLRQPGRRDGRELVRPPGGRVPQRPGPRPGRGREPVRRRRRTSPGTRWRASATTR